MGGLGTKWVVKFYRDLKFGETERVKVQEVLTTQSKNADKQKRSGKPEWKSHRDPDCRKLWTFT